MRLIIAAAITVLLLCAAAEAGGYRVVRSHCGTFHYRVPAYKAPVVVKEKVVVPNINIINVQPEHLLHSSKTYYSYSRLGDYKALDVGLSLDRLHRSLESNQQITANIGASIVGTIESERARELALRQQYTLTEQLRLLGQLRAAPVTPDFGRPLALQGGMALCTGCHEGWDDPESLPADLRGEMVRRILHSDPAHRMPRAPDGGPGEPLTPEQERWFIEALVR